MLTEGDGGVLELDGDVMHLDPDPVSEGVRFLGLEPTSHQTSEHPGRRDDARCDGWRGADADRGGSPHLCLNQG